MPKGVYERKPRPRKQYDPDLVAAVKRLYVDGMSQTEVAHELRITQKVVWRLMEYHGIERRPQVKRDQRGEKNDSWKGRDATYSAFHLRVAAIRGAPSVCEECGTTEAKRFEWASLTKNYADVNDYKRMCGSCHHKFDGTVRNLGTHAKRKDDIQR